MADGDLVYSTQGCKIIKLSDAAGGGTTTGHWVDCGEYDIGSIVIDFAPGTFVGTYEVDLSNATAQPADAANGVPAATGTTASAVVNLAACPRWIKGRISAFTSGTISVNAVLRNNGT